jgi:hypothetical protein
MSVFMYLDPKPDRQKATRARHPSGYHHFLDERPHSKDGTGPGTTDMDTEQSAAATF